MAQHDKGDLVRVSAVFTDNSSGAVVDPTAVMVDVTDPAGVTTTLTYLTDVAVVRDSAGNYHADVDADQSGVWFYHWYSTGTGQASGESQFEVRPSRF